MLELILGRGASLLANISLVPEGIAESIPRSFTLQQAGCAGVGIAWERSWGVRLAACLAQYLDLNGASRVWLGKEAFKQQSVDTVISSCLFSPANRWFENSLSQKLCQSHSSLAVDPPLIYLILYSGCQEVFDLYSIPFHVPIHKPFILLMGLDHCSFITSCSKGNWTEVSVLEYEEDRAASKFVSPLGEFSRESISWVLLTSLPEA